MTFDLILANVRRSAPLVHCITNYVTVNDCANALLACGASPIMADDIGEAADITQICTALCINIGTLNKNTIASMFAAAQRAQELYHPVLLDPVGAGASALRTSTAQKLVEKIDFSVIRGNISEIKALAAGGGSTKGVDANALDAVNDENLDDAVAFIKEYAAKTGAVAAVTGAIDIVADSQHAYVIRNGHRAMSRITGTGCMLSACMAAFIGANSAHILDAAAAAVCAFGICGEIGVRRMSKEDGNAALRGYIIDALCNLSGETLCEEAKYEIR
ncbi:MAG: hydroxyethylthiazole kinase [Clostridia bacterium]|nr:hydroxyethylthiazole kinase [Clostridia bacterium]